MPRATPPRLPFAPFAALLACAGLILAPVPGLAAPEPEPDPSEASDAPEAPDEVLVEAKRLFDAGVARYTAADYEAAVDLWLEAYALVPPSFDNRLIKAELIYNVARAQQKWFDIDRDVKHLRQSREILTRYLDELDDLYGDQAGMEREKVEEQIAAIDDQVTQWEAEQARREAELAERMRPTFDEEADARDAKRNKAMIISGASLTTVGVSGAGMLVVGLILAGGANRKVGDLPLEADIAARQSAVSRGQTGNALQLIGVLTAGVFLSAGVPLLAVGLRAERKRKGRRVDAGVDEARVDAIAPMWTRGGAGLSLVGRF